MTWANHIEILQDGFSVNNSSVETLTSEGITCMVYSSNESDYMSVERKQRSPHRRRCIDGKTTGCGSCVGYCTFIEHPGYLTQQLRKTHNCIKKGCHYYRPKEKPAAAQPYLVTVLSKYVCTSRHA